MVQREASIEDYLKQRAEALGGVCIKLSPTGLRGVPDRLMVLSGPRVVFVELKRPSGGVISKLQHWWRARLLALGCEHHFIKTRAEVDALIENRKHDERT
jgi:hypothetical protein